MACQLGGSSSPLVPSLYTGHTGLPALLELKDTKTLDVLYAWNALIPGKPLSQIPSPPSSLFSDPPSVVSSFPLTDCKPLNSITPAAA